MAKLSLSVIAAMAAGASAFAPVAQTSAKASLKAADQGIWDPLQLYELGSGEAFDTFPNMFPAKQYLDDSEKKHGRMVCLVAILVRDAEFCWAGEMNAGNVLCIIAPGLPAVNFVTFRRHNLNAC
jgi:hypothetical protein